MYFPKACGRLMYFPKACGGLTGAARRPRSELVGELLGGRGAARRATAAAKQDGADSATSRPPAVQRASGPAVAAAPGSGGRGGGVGGVPSHAASAASDATPPRRVVHTFTHSHGVHSRDASRAARTARSRAPPCARVTRRTRRPQPRAARAQQRAPPDAPHANHAPRRVPLHGRARNAHRRALCRAPF